MKAILGSAQFGLSYGITNLGGKVSRETTLDIITKAKKLGISIIDTAAVYGDSEKILGDICSKIGGFDFISKIQIMHDTTQEAVKGAIEKSCTRLRSSQLYGLLVHNAHQFLSLRYADSIWNELLEQKRNGRIEKIGVSVYSPNQAREILKRFNIDMIQIPCNVLDQRFIESGMIEELKAHNVEVHCRSIFLQGLLLADSNFISSKFIKALPKFQIIDNICIKKKINKLDIILGYIKGIQDFDGVVFGVTTANELEEIMDVLSNTSSNIIKNIDFSKLAMLDKEIIDPSLWE
tara:strand:+ start:45 stop:920 length:876 start_codon:yes stop_codon:yes gene_type:complete